MTLFYVIEACATQQQRRPLTSPIHSNKKISNYRNELRKHKRLFFVVGGDIVPVYVEDSSLLYRAIWVEERTARVYQQEHGKMYRYRVKWRDDRACG